MGSLFNPAIALMNKLSYTKKFMVLGLIALLATLIALFNLYSNLNKSIDTMHHELMGIGHVKIVTRMIQLTQKHRAHSAGVLNGNVAMQADLTNIEKETATAYLTLSQKLPASHVASNDFNEIKRDWLWIQNNGLTVSVKDNFLAHTDLTTHLLDFNDTIADNYALSLDNRLDSYSLIQAIIKIPANMELAGRVRGYGVALLSHQTYSEEEKTQVTLAMSELEGGLDEFARHLKKASRYNPTLRTILHQLQLNSLSEMRDILHQLRVDVIQKNQKVEARAFFNASTSTIDNIYQVGYAYLLPELERTLKQRIQHEKNTLFLTLGIICVLFLFVVYFAIGGFLSITRNLQSFATSANAITGGNIHQRIQLETRDELAQVGDSFNEMADGLARILKEQESQKMRLHSVIDTALDAVVEMDHQGNISAWNKQAEKIFGWAAAEVLNQPLHLFIIPEQYRALHIKGIAHYLATGEGPMLNKRIEISALHRLGHEFPIELAISPNLIHGTNTFSAFIRDISDRKIAEESMQLASMVYQSSIEAMVVTDDTNSIISVNPAFTNTTGYTANEVRGKVPYYLDESTAPHDVVDSIREAIFKTGKWQGEIWSKRKSGEHYPSWLTINTIYDESGGIHRRVALFFDITDKKQNEEVIWKQAHFDELTGLPNRRMIHNKLEDAVREKKPLVLFYLDLDRFKEVNDSLGHEMGDELLKEAARRMESCVRQADTVGRLAGDEFTIILHHLSDTSIIERIANNVLKKLRLPFYLGEDMAYVSGSIGITLFPHDANDAVNLLKNADQAMYVAKNNGRNCYQYYTPSMQTSANERMRLINEMHIAIETHQFQVHYQPIFDFETNQFCKAEALVRWEHPTLGMISPAKFIPLAEETGLIVALGDWVFNQALVQIVRCHEHYSKDFQISINKSPLQFKAGQRHHAAWMKQLKKLNLPGHSIAIEITENLLLEAKDEISHQLLDFRDHGIQVALDDFGTGYSSLSYLRKFDIDYLKIDQSFVQNLSFQSNDLALCEAIIVMAHKLGIKVVAEGVETQEQAQLLKQIGCDYGQGFLWSKPLPQTAFEKLLGFKP